MPSRSSGISFEQQDLVAAVGLFELDADALRQGRGDVLADVVGPDRQLPVAPVDEDRQLHPGRPAVFEERVDRGPDRPTGEEDVVDEDDRLALQREVELRPADEWLGWSGAAPLRTRTSSR